MSSWEFGAQAGLSLAAVLSCPDCAAKIREMRAELLEMWRIEKESPLDWEESKNEEANVPDQSDD